MKVAFVSLFIHLRRLRLFKVVEVLMLLELSAWGGTGGLKGKVSLLLPRPWLLV